MKEVIGDLGLHVIAHGLVIAPVVVGLGLFALLPIWLGNHDLGLPDKGVATGVDCGVMAVAGFWTVVSYAWVERKPSKRG